MRPNGKGGGVGARQMLWFYNKLLNSPIFRMLLPLFYDCVFSFTVLYVFDKFSCVFITFFIIFAFITISVVVVVVIIITVI